LLLRIKEVSELPRRVLGDGNHGNLRYDVRPFSQPNQVVLKRFSQSKIANLKSKMR
jgi:hypothetical protein